jgi:excisionase family DNA binding protein
MSDDLTRTLAKELANALPEALDDSTLERLAAKLRPYITPGFDSPRTQDRLLTAGEAASEARVHVETIRRAIRAGELPVAGRVGRSHRIRAVELERWLAEASGSGGTISQPVTRRVRRQATPPDYSLTAAFRAAAPDNT